MLAHVLEESHVEKWVFCRPPTAREEYPKVSEGV